jgi:hypothetical protein
MNIFSIFLKIIYERVTDKIRNIYKEKEMSPWKKPVMDLLVVSDQGPITFI